VLTAGNVNDTTLFTDILAGIRVTRPAGGPAPDRNG